jgi:hypothetical protein
MSRLFITTREIDFISDLTKEIIKDVIGQKIFYYNISLIKSKVHDLYSEAPDKIFEMPVVIDCRVKWMSPEIRTNNFGTEEYYKIEAYVQGRDMIQRGISLNIGDFFSYGDVFFEVTSLFNMRNIFGQVEHVDGWKISATQSRQSNFVSKVFGPTSETHTDADAVQKDFYQQRGFESNDEGGTGDMRDLVRKGVLDPPISGPAKVKADDDVTRDDASFYDET